MSRRSSAPVLRSTIGSRCQLVTKARDTPPRTVTAHHATPGLATRRPIPARQSAHSSRGVASASRMGWRCSRRESRLDRSNRCCKANTNQRRMGYIQCPPSPHGVTSKLHTLKLTPPFNFSCPFTSRPLCVSMALVVAGGQAGCGPSQQRLQVVAARARGHDAALADHLHSHDRHQTHDERAEQSPRDGQWRERLRLCRQRRRGHWPRWLRWRDGFTARCGRVGLQRVDERAKRVRHALVAQGLADEALERGERTPNIRLA
jgi:hypothetical protein